jgi:gamma-D-glutamyl-L-lysine dipeptidyl-peptidase
VNGYAIFAFAPGWRHPHPRRVTRRLLILGFAAFVICGCRTTQSVSTEPASEADSIIATVQAKYAPDRKLAVFDVTATREGSRLILKGEVGEAAAKAELLQSFSSKGINVSDQIVVLPSTQLRDQPWGLVRVSVANIRDQQAQGAELGTQVLMGNAVRLWKSNHGWFYVQSADRYLGWMEDDMVLPCTQAQLDAWKSAKKLFVTAFADRIWSEPSSDSEPICDVVTGGLVKPVGQTGDWFKVELPDGRVGYLSKNSAVDQETWKQSRHPNPDNIEHTARSLMGLPYLWGGTSVKGLDCSGFTKTVYFLNGIDLDRNASHQVRQGIDIPVDANLSAAKKGDLLFFGSRGSNGRPDRVSHVGIYLGDKKFIHSSGMVKINSLDRNSPILDDRRRRMLIKIRRFLPETAQAAK